MLGCLPLLKRRRSFVGPAAGLTLGLYGLALGMLVLLGPIGAPLPVRADETIRIQAVLADEGEAAPLLAAEGQPPKMMTEDPPTVPVTAATLPPPPAEAEGQTPKAAASGESKALNPVQGVGATAIASGAPVTVGGQTPNETAPLEVAAWLRQNLPQHLVYPPIARQRGWAGSVQCWVTVAGDGQLHGLELRRSSGFRLLDEAALQAIRACFPLAGAAAGGFAYTVVFDLRG